MGRKKRIADERIPARVETPPVSAGVLALLAVLTFFCFSSVLGAGFVNWDDDFNFLQNYGYRGLSFEHLRWMFTNATGHYVPLAWMTLGLDYALWGMNAAGYHATNLLLHVVNVLLAYRLLLRVLATARPEATHVSYGAALGALFFGLHPLRVESVAWISERRDVLSATFALLTVLAYWRAVEPGGRRRWWIVSWGCFALALLSKAHVAVLPLVLLVLDVYPLRRLSAESTTPKRLFAEKIPYLLMALVAVVVAFGALAREGAFGHVGPRVGADALLQPGYRVFFYLAKTIYPRWLSPLYSYRPLEAGASTQYWLAAIGLVAGTLFLFRARRRWPGAWAAWACALILLAPFLGLVQFGSHFAADRNTYLAALAAAAVVGGLAQRRWATGWGGRAAAGAILLALAIATTHQVAIWKNSIALWDRAVAVTPSATAFYNRGMARLLAGDNDGALADFDEVIRREPKDARPHQGRGLARLAKKDFPKAIEELTEAIRLEPRLVQAFRNRAGAKMAKGDIAGAIEDCNEVLKIDPRDPVTHRNRALARAQSGDVTAALVDASRAIELDPFDHESYAVRGLIRVRAGDGDNAMPDFERALRLAPADWDRRKDIERRLQNQRIWRETPAAQRAPSSPVPLPAARDR